MSLSYPLTDIAEPGPNDVLCGRGGASNNHIGNRRFRMLVNEHRIRYKNSGKLDKPKIAREIMVIWRNQSPPGRFLCKVAGTKLWNDVGDQKAREKASQCLRERVDPADVEKLQSTENEACAHKMSIDKELDPPKFFSNETVPSMQDTDAVSQQHYLTSKLQYDLHEQHEQQEHLIQLQYLQRKVDQVISQQHNFTNFYSELTQVSLQRQDQEQLHHVQEELRIRREELEQEQLALMRGMQLNCHLHRPHMMHISSTAEENNYGSNSPRVSHALHPLINDVFDKPHPEANISWKVSTSTSNHVSDDNADALSMLWSVESKLDAWRSNRSDGSGSLGGEPFFFNWSRNSLPSVSDDSDDSVDLDCSFRSFRHLILDKESMDGIHNSTYSSHSGSIIDTAHSLLSFRSDKDSVDLNHPSSSLSRTKHPYENSMRQCVPCGSQVDDTVSWTSISRVDREQSIVKASKAALAVASTLSTKSISESNLAELTSFDAAMEEIKSSITRFSSRSAPWYCDEKYFAPLSERHRVNGIGI